MPAFEPPKRTLDKNKTWRRVAKQSFCDTEKLWDTYWQRFNTISIPLQDEDAYFADAICAAQQAESREHLEEILAEKCRERRRELEEITHEIALAAIQLQVPFPCEATRYAALKIGRTGSLDSFMQFASGVIFGRGGPEKGPFPPVRSAEHDSGSSDGDDTHGGGEVPLEGDLWDDPNQLPEELLSSPECSDHEEDDSWRVTECDDKPSSKAQGLSAEPRSKTHVDRLDKPKELEASLEQLETKPYIASASSATSLSSTPPSSLSLDAADIIPITVSSNSPSLSQCTSPPAQATEKPYGPAALAPCEGQEASRQVQSGALTNSSPSKKRSRGDSSDDEGQERRKRRLVQVD